MDARTPASLLPVQTGGKIFIKGFHRTKTEDAVVSIGFEKVKESNANSLYGRGFYMTRTLAAQQRATMESYGHMIVGCRVDISRFIAFDRAIARRLWGHRHSLKSQLKHFGPWTNEQQEAIDELSSLLTKFWNEGRFIIDRKVKPKKIISTIFNRSIIRNHIVDHTSVIAKATYNTLGCEFIKKVPGILYTGSRDNACVLAYDLSRVKPLVFRREVPLGYRKKEKTNKWSNFACRSIIAALSPPMYFKDAVQSYAVALARLDRPKMEELVAGYFNIPETKILDRWAYLVALEAHASRSKIGFTAFNIIFHLDIYEKKDGPMLSFLKLRPFPALNTNLVQDTIKNKKCENNMIYKVPVSNDILHKDELLVSEILDTKHCMLKACLLPFLVQDTVRDMNKILRDAYRKISSYKQTEKTTKILKSIFYTDIRIRYYIYEKDIAYIFIDRYKFKTIYAKKEPLLRQYVRLDERSLTIIKDALYYQLLQFHKAVSALPNMKNHHYYFFNEWKRKNIDKIPKTRPPLLDLVKKL